MSSRLVRTFFVSVLALAPAAYAGPPLLCHPIAIGDARSLPWGSAPGWNTPRSDYDPTHLAQDTLALLGPQTRVLARMETLRRAAIYASTDADAAKALFDALRGRAGQTNPHALAQFDLGYGVEAYRQARHMVDRLVSGGPTEDGYALVRQALRARGPDPEMEYAAALMTIGDRALRDLSDKHLEAALDGARKDSDLARTIDAHRQIWGERIPRSRAADGR